jgi:hypothetical protein
MKRNAVLRAVVLAVGLGASMPALADDSAASIAAGGLVPRRETRIVMAKEVLRISDKKVVVDYDFRNDTDEDVTTEVAFPVPPYWYEVVDGNIAEQSFSSFRLFVGGKPVPFKTEVKATLDGRDVTGVLVADKIDIAGFGHTDESAGDETGGNYPIRDLIRLPKAEQERLKAWGLFNMDEGFPLASWAVHLQYHWKQMFPAHSTVHIRHEYSPLEGWKYIVPSPEIILLANKPTYVRDAAKLNAADREDLELLASFCPETLILRELASKVDVESNGRRDVALLPHWVDFILTSANTWQRPIEDFTLIIERTQPEQDKKTLISFCSPNNGKVEKLDADHFQVHLTNFVPTSELHIGFFEVPLAKPAQPAVKK